MRNTLPTTQTVTKAKQEVGSSLEGAPASKKHGRSVITFQKERSLTNGRGRRGDTIGPETFSVLHISDQYLFAVAQDGAEFSREQDEHIWECEECAYLFTVLTTG